MKLFTPLMKLTISMWLRFVWKPGKWLHQQLKLHQMFEYLFDSKHYQIIEVSGEEEFLNARIYDDSIRGIHQEALSLKHYPNNLHSPRRKSILSVLYLSSFFQIFCYILFILLCITYAIFFRFFNNPQSTIRQTIGTFKNTFLLEKKNTMS